jgi:putative SOS response-associated peptidase YedK
MGLAPLLDEGALEGSPADQRALGTAATSGMFKEALARRRCVVPADAFYEWKVIESGK